MAGCTGSTRATTRRSRSPRWARTASPISGSTGFGAGSWPSARTTPATANRDRRSSTSPSTAIDRRESCMRAPISSPLRGRRPTGAGSPGSNGITPTCRGTPHACGSPRSPTTAASVRAIWPPAASTNRSSSRSGRPTGSSTSSAIGRAGGTSTVSHRGRASSRYRRSTPSSPIRPGCSTVPRTASCPTARSWRSAAHEVGTACSTYRRTR